MRNSKMFIKVFVKGYLKRNYAQNEQISLNVNKNICVKELEQILNLPADIPKICCVNQTKVSPDCIIKENDEIIFVPIVGGG